mgnify:CR=1 FL=1
MLETILKDFGLNEKERRIYRALLRMGPVGATQIAKDAGLPRQTAYSLLDHLVSLDLIEQSDKRGIRQFSADIYHLQELLDQKKRALEINKKGLEEEIPSIIADSLVAREIPLVQYYQGQEGLMRLFDSMLCLYRKGKHTTFRGYGLSKPYPGLEQYIMNWIKERHKLGVKAKVFVPKEVDFSSIGGGENTLGRKFKVLDIEEQPAALYLVGNRVYLFSYKDNVGVMIENRSIAELLKSIYEDHWQKTNA